ncbi:EXS domain-containing protein [Citrus sinensis]|nr:EXS domain-containing protein [Citrus sinensis]KAH9788137.1 EXS domain-containing protein [Citrus sinensis]
MLFLIWGIGCCKIGWESVLRMGVDLRDLFLYEAFLYYNPLLLVTMMVWLWGVNLWVFSQGSANYAKIFDLDQNHLTHHEIWKAITFPDFFLADILTSMAKVFSDLERSICRMVHRQVATIAWFEADSVCGSHSIAIPLVLVFPYLCRLLQCLRQYKDTKEKTTLLNALKYSTAVPVIFLSALKYHVFPHKWSSVYRPLWLLSSVINSLYSFYWDVTRDWDLSGFSRIFKFNKPSFFSNLLYGRQWIYFWVIGSNLILRCTWTYKLSAHLRHNHLTVFAVAVLEMLRRFQWIFFRVENMACKLCSQRSSSTGTGIGIADAATSLYYCAFVLVGILLLSSCSSSSSRDQDRDTSVSIEGTSRMVLNKYEYSRPCDEIYVVGEGETLHTISDKCGDPFIVEHNPHIHDPDDLFPGLVIKITAPPF